MSVLSTRLGSTAVLPGELLCEAVDVHPSEKVLDVTAGDNAVSVAATRRFADVSRADVAAGPDLPFPDDTFDAVLSAFGAMFAPDPQRVARELIRVCRPGGRIGMCNWLPDSVITRAFAWFGPASEWGVAARVRELFGNRVSSLELTTRAFVFRYRCATHMRDDFRTVDGAGHTAFAALDEGAQRQLSGQLIETFSRHNHADDGTLIVPSGYLEIVAEVR
jgi:SAM-dependent methyltransferase